MSDPGTKKILSLLAAAAAVWVGGTYLLPLLLPFLAGLLLALAAEPGVKLLTRKLGLKRGPGAFLGVTVTLVLLTGVILLLCSVAVKELTNLSAILPDLESSVRQGLTSLQDWLLSLAMGAPEGIRGLLTRGVLALFDSGSTMYDQALSQLPRMASGLVSHLTGSFLSLGTGILSAYFISARLPMLRARLGRKLPESWRDRYLPALKGLKTAVLGWLRAQSKLLVLTFVIVCAGLLLLRIPYAPIWAVLIAIVDAVPMLGTGIVLVPWSLISFVQGEPAQALGLLGIFAAATLTRSTLEPRLLGKQLGLDPLVTLAALYLGYRLFGILGMLLSPMLAVTVVQLVKADPPQP